MDTQALSEVAKKLREPKRAARFVGVDLHVHSPESFDYTGSELSAEEFVQGLAEQGLAIVAITDHNTGEYIDKAVDAADSLRESSTADV